VARKIAVMGSSCSGKTTVAGLLAARLGVPQTELDALHHGPNWQEANAEELRARLDRVLSGTNGWVANGNYMGKLGTRLIDQADTIVWLDLPLWILVQRRSPREVESWLAEQPEG
jgi:adenylate kinase family enzyme